MEIFVFIVLAVPCGIFSFLLYKIWKMNSDSHWQARFHNDQSKFTNILKKNDMSLQYVRSKKQMIICIRTSSSCGTFGIRQAMQMILQLQSGEMNVSSFKDLIIEEQASEEDRRSTKEQFLDRIF